MQQSPTLTRKLEDALHGKEFITPKITRGGPYSRRVVGELTNFKNDNGNLFSVPLTTFIDSFIGNRIEYEFRQFLYQNCRLTLKFPPKRYIVRVTLRVIKTSIGNSILRIVHTE